MFTFDFKKEDLRKFLPTNKESDEWFEVLESLLPLYSIETPERVAGFLSQCGYESNHFTRIMENLNYSEAALNRVFGKYFGNKRNAKNYARKPEKIANVVYANRMENGSIKSGDGWKYRGRGIIQLTGKRNYRKFGEHVGMSTEEVIEYLETKYGAAHAAAWYWLRNDLNKYADRGDVTGMTKAINGGTHGLAGRKRLYKKATGMFGVSATPTLTNDYPVFGIGDNGEGVKRMQKLLGITADGDFGPNTKRAVKSFQKSKGLLQDGVAGKKTLKALGY